MNSYGSRRGRRTGFVSNSLGDLVNQAITPAVEAKKAYAELKGTYLKEVKPKDGRPGRKYWEVFPEAVLRVKEKPKIHEAEHERSREFIFSLKDDAVHFVRNLWFAHEFFKEPLKVLKFMGPLKSGEASRLFRERLEELEARAQTYGRWSENAERMVRLLGKFKPTKVDLLRASQSPVTGDQRGQPLEETVGSPAVADLIQEVEERASYRAGNPDDACEKALYFLALGRPEIAHRIAREVLGPNPDHPIALYANAVVLLDASERHQKKAFMHDVMHPHDLPPLEAEEHYHADRHEQESLAAWEKAGEAFVLMLKAYENWPNRFGIKRYEFEPVMWQHRVEGWILRSGAARVTEDPTGLGLMKQQETADARATLTRVVAKLWKEQRGSVYDAFRPDRLRDFLVLASHLNVALARECLRGLDRALSAKAVDGRESYWERHIWLPIGPEASLAEGLCGAPGDAEFCRSVFRCLGALDGMKFLRGIEQLGNAQRLDRLHAAHSIALRHQVSFHARSESWREGLEVCRSMAEDHAWPESELGRKLRSCWRYGLIILLFEGSRLMFKENEPGEAAELMVRALEKVDAWFGEITGEQPMVRFWECDENAEWETVGDFLLRQSNCLTGGTISQCNGTNNGVIPKLQAGWWDEFLRWAEGNGYGEAPVLLAYAGWLRHKIPGATELVHWCRALEARLRPS